MQRLRIALTSPGAATPDFIFPQIYSIFWIYQIKFIITINIIIIHKRERKRKTNVQGVTMEGSKDLVQPTLGEKKYMFTVKYIVDTLNIA
nr:hypothetical protein Iba_chr11aCG8910 [Ipomoea batatas]